jgi:hypothetical protein
MPKPHPTGPPPPPPVPADQVELAQENQGFIADAQAASHEALVDRWTAIELAKLHAGEQWEELLASTRAMVEGNLAK